MRILKRQIEQYDRQKPASLIREIEMAVDQATTIDPAYGIQFWKDMDLYGIKEAVAYLDSFVKSKIKNPEAQREAMQDVLALCTKVEEIFGPSPRNTSGGAVGGSSGTGL